MDIFSLIPKHKSDTSGIQHLTYLSDDEIRPIIRPLLERIKDMNWPVAPDIIRILSLHQTITEPQLIQILQPKEDDDIWKYWIIDSLLPSFQQAPSELLLAALKRIADHPTPGERTEQVDQAAKDYILRRSSINSR